MNIAISRKHGGGLGDLRLHEVNFRFHHCHRVFFVYEEVTGERFAEDIGSMIRSASAKTSATAGEASASLRPMFAYWLPCPGNMSDFAGFVGRSRGDLSSSLSTPVGCRTPDCFLCFVQAVEQFIVRAEVGRFRRSAAWFVCKNTVSGREVRRGGVGLDRRGRGRCRGCFSGRWGWSGEGEDAAEGLGVERSKVEG